MTVLLIHSHYGPTPAPFATAVADGRVNCVRERDLTIDDFEHAAGLITTSHLDQLGFLLQMPVVKALLARNGRWFFNGHMLRRFLDGLEIFRPLPTPKRQDYVLTKLDEHPIFADIERSNLEQQHGVSGFYGRGHNPMPATARAITGVGPDRLPIDWVWALPDGGQIFCHGGDDLVSMGSDMGLGAVLAGRIVAWCAGEIG